MLCFNLGQSILMVGVISLAEIIWASRGELARPVHHSNDVMINGPSVAQWINNRCFSMRNGLSEEIPDGLARSVCPQLRSYPVSTRENDEEYLRKYSQTCAIQTLTKTADNIRNRGVYGKCYRGVKEIVSQSAPWMFGSLGRPNGARAIQARGELQDRGFVDILPAHPEYRMNPEKAPAGAILVFARVDRKPRTVRANDWRRMEAGDIQIRTPEGFVNDHKSRQPRTRQPNGEGSVLVGVLIRPLQIGEYDRRRNCYNSSINNVEVQVPTSAPEQMARVAQARVYAGNPRLASRTRLSRR